MPDTVLYLDHAPILGGAERVLVNLLRRLDRARYRPVVATASGSPLLPRLRAVQVESATIRFGRLNRAGAALPFNLMRAAAEAAHLARRQRAALIHTNTVRAHLVGAIAARLAGIPLLWTLHDNTFPPRLARLLAPTTAGAIAVAGWLRDLYAPAGLAAKLRVIPNGLEIDPPLPPDGLREELAIPPGRPVVLSVGRLVPGKAPDLFLAAARHVAAEREAAFLLVGGPDPPEPGGPASSYPEDLAAAARRSGLGERLRLVGHREDVARFYRLADVVVYTAVRPEGLPTVILEAMVHARPVVAAAVGGALEIIEEGVNGWLVPPGDAEALAERIIGLLRDPSRAGALGRSGRATVERHFDIKRQVAETMRFYDDILSRRR